MEQDRGVPLKKPYTSPSLWVHGGIEQLTQNAGVMGKKADTRGKIADTKTA
jgi:hypothetical protein